VPVASQAARRTAMVLLAIVYMFNFIDRTILSILLPSIREEFGSSDAFLGFLAGTAFAIFYTVLGIPVARVADRCNRRNLIASAVAIWSLMTALSGMAANVVYLTLARIGVGIGEAGCSPPAHSIIADYYPPENRSTAMGFYTAGISAGIMLAYLAGGWVAENIGWRAAFFIVGLPGLVLAAFVRFSLVEPCRGFSEQRQATASQPGLLQVARFLTHRPSFWHMAVAAGLSSFVGYAVINFLPSFIDRSFAIARAEIGFWLGLILGIAGGCGFFLGGYVADRLGRKGQQRALLFIAITVLVSALLLVLMFLSRSWTVVLLLFVLPAMTMNVYLAPVLAQTQSLVSLHMRATASALVLFIINIIGLALGSWVTGIISDWLEPGFGKESMRYSLLLVTVVILPWASWHFYRAGRTIDGDLARASEYD